MKIAALIATFALLGMTTIAQFSPANAAAFGAMSGKSDYATRGYKQPTKPKPAKRAKTMMPKQQ